MDFLRKTIDSDVPDEVLGKPRWQNSAWENDANMKQKGTPKITKNHKKKDPNTSATESALTDKLGMRVFINNRKNNSGTLTFEYKELDQLDRLIGVIKNNY